MIDKTLPLLTKAKTQEEEIFYLFHLRTAKPWNAGQLQTYLPYFARERNGMAHPPEVTRWFKEAGRPYSHGSSYANFMKNFYNSAVTNLPLSQRTEVETLIAEAAPTPDKPRPHDHGRGGKAHLCEGMEDGRLRLRPGTTDRPT